MAKKKIVRQDWQPHWSMEMLYKIWRVIFAAFKIVIGSAATVLLILVVSGFVLLGVLGDYLESDILPSASLVLENYNMDEPSYVYYVNGSGEINELQKIHASTDWQNADYEEIPENLIHAAVAIEDKRFYEHQGVDWFTTIKAFANMFFGDETVGGSSITQQLIKNRTGEDSVTVQRKVLEFFRATLVEKNYDKQTIMELYLNSIYLGQGCRGVKSAAETYFGKELQSLTLAECASLISITNNPSLFDPYSQSEYMYDGEMTNGMMRNCKRKLLVLSQMFNQGYISREEYNEATAQPIILKNGIDPQDRWVVCSNPACTYAGIASTYATDESGHNHVCPACAALTPIEKDNSQDVYSYFVDTVLDDVAKALAEKDGITEWNDDIWKDYMDQISRSGYRIYSTYKENVQAQVDSVYKDLSQIPSPRSSQQLQSAIVIVDNTTGDIVAMAGGVGTEKQHFGLNRATQSRLQSGSSIKPLTVYAPGFEQGTINPATVVRDLPLTYSGGAWPKNDDRTYGYSSSILSGITRSVNAVAANTLKLIGDAYGLDFAKNKFGLSTLDDEEDLNFSSLALGAQYHGVTVRDMTCAFATFANKGVYREGRTFTKVYDSRGNLVLDNTQTARHILSDKTVNYMNYCLYNAANSGTGAGAIFNSTMVCGKTGTTSSSRDRWFCGYTKYYTAAIWCGFDTPAVISLGYNPSANLWRKVMKPLHNGVEYQSLYTTEGMVSVSVCLDSGGLATDTCRNDVRGNRTVSAMVYPEDAATMSFCKDHVTVDYCESGDGVATEYCKHFAEANVGVSIGKKSLLKLTQSQFEDIQSAMSAGLDAEFFRDDYVYLTTSSGADANFSGFHNDINRGVNAPYKVCTVHTKAAWERYLATGIPGA